MNYTEFIRSKVIEQKDAGFEIDPTEINPLLKPHQRDIVLWMVRGGRRACFASFGLGKTFIQIEAVRLTLTRTGGMGLIVLPLGVRNEFVMDAQKLDIKVKFVRRIEDCDDPNGIYLTNYETVRDGKLDPRAFTVASLDEAAVLRGFGGTKTFREFMALFAGDDRRDRFNMPIRHAGVPYRFVATATPSPNEYIELLAYAAYLDVMDVSAAKTRFFKRDSVKADNLTLHPHKIQEFWLWVASWAVFIQKPSDLCRCVCHRESNYKEESSDGSRCNHGHPMQKEMERGSVSANAEIRNTQPQTTCSKELSSVADALDQNTDGRGNQFIKSGKQCSTDVEGQKIKTGQTTVVEESRSVSDGKDLPISSQTWEYQNQAKRSTGKTITETTSQATANGLLEKNKQTTEDHLKRGYCDECRCDDGYILPELDIRWHEVKLNDRDFTFEKNGQGMLVPNPSLGVTESSREKRVSVQARIAKMMEIRAEDPCAHRIIWHDLEAERHAIEKAVPEVASVYGTQGLDDRELIISSFSAGLIKELAAKPVMLGSGVNLQRHCHWAVYLGIGFKFNDFIQSIHRLQRFLQTERVRIDLIYTDAEIGVRRSLERKWEQHKEMVQKMTDLIKEYGLSHAAMMEKLNRAFGVERIEVRGERFTMVNNDSVIETRNMKENSVGLILTSIPFSTQYEYSPNYCDFGHTDTNDHFFQQMDFLTPELLRVLQPGRIAAIHVKDRIVPMGISNMGFQTVYEYHCDVIKHFKRHGFGFMGMKTIVTDVVRENNQTYRLGWTEQCKDGTKMGVGMPEYLLIFRKPPTDTSNAYADIPVEKSKDNYTRARWQIDAHAFTRSSGNRLLTPKELAALSHKQIFQLFKKFSLETSYNFEHHVKIGEDLDEKGRLPVTFMLLQPQSWHPDVWSDITRMLTLNSSQYAGGKQMHLCPLQFDIADRAITQWSNPGDAVYDPFAGIGTVPFRSVLLGRYGCGCELSNQYFLDGVNYCHAAEEKLAMPDMFAAIEEEEVNVTA